MLELPESVIYQEMHILVKDRPKGFVLFPFCRESNIVDVLAGLKISGDPFGGLSRQRFKGLNGLSALSSLKTMTVVGIGETNFISGKRLLKTVRNCSSRGSDRLISFSVAFPVR